MAEFDVGIFTENLEKVLAFISEEVRSEVQAALGELAQGAYDLIRTGLMEKAKTDESRNIYLEALSITPISDGHIILLNSSAAERLEDKIEPYDMKPGFLNSTSMVTKGSRAGQPWVKVGEDGDRYAHIPFNKKPAVLEKSSGDLVNDIKKLSAVNMRGRKQKITSIFKDLDGIPQTGLVATVKPKTTIHPYLQGLAKYQSIGENGKVNSDYIVFRTVSDKSPPDSWKHPGAPGYGLFLEAEDYVEDQLNRIIDIML